MKSGYRVRFDPKALDALEEAADFIERESGTSRALAWLDAMREGAQKLEIFPRAFPVATRRRGRSIRSKRIMRHRVFYVIDEPARLIYVIDIVHTARESKLAEYRDPNR